MFCLDNWFRDGFFMLFAPLSLRAQDGHWD